MRTTYELTEPWWRAEAGPDGTVHVRCDERSSFTTIRTSIPMSAARGLHRQLGRVIQADDSDPAGGYSIKELMNVRQSICDPNADMDEARGEIVAVLDAYMRLIEKTKETS